MSREDELKKTRLFDRRTVERNIKRGRLSRAEYQAYLESLPDLSSKLAAPEEPASEGGAFDEGLDDEDEEDDEDESAHASSTNGASA